jgi:hypothetical protein
LSDSDLSVNSLSILRETRLSLPKLRVFYLDSKNIGKNNLSPLLQCFEATLLEITAGIKSQLKPLLFLYNLDTNLWRATFSGSKFSINELLSQYLRYLYAINFKKYKHSEENMEKIIQYLTKLPNFESQFINNGKKYTEEEKAKIQETYNQPITLLIYI